MRFEGYIKLRLNKKLSKVKKGESSVKDIYYLDTFTGMAGLRIGVEDSLREHGYNPVCVKSVEIKKHALETIRHLYPDEETVRTDITKLDTSELPHIDGLIGGFPCFTGDTLVLTKQGYKQIKDIQVGDEVLTHKKRYKKVLNVFNQGLKDIVHLTGDGFDTLKVTDNHKFYVRYLDDSGQLQEPEWLELKHLTTNHYLGFVCDEFEQTYQELPELTGITSITEGGYTWLPFSDRRPIIGQEIVYDIEVEEDHSFTANNVIAHNCQTFSTAGKQAGFEDTRGTLFYELARIMRDKRPKWCIFENVKGLVKHDGGRTLTVIMRTFHDLGYHVSFQMMDAKDYGLSGSRPRIYIVCTRDTPVELFIPPHDRIPFSAIKENLKPDWTDYTKKLLDNFTPDELRGRKIGDKKTGPNVIHSWEFEARGEVSQEQIELLEYLVNFQTSPQFNKNGKTIPFDVIYKRFGESSRVLLDDLESKTYIKYNHSNKDASIKGCRLLFGQLSGQFTHIIDENQPLPTLTATDADRMAVIEGNGLRGITITEALKALGFPEGYTFPDTVSLTNQYDLLGNTVAPPVVKLVMDEIIKQGGLDETD